MGGGLDALAGLHLAWVTVADLPAGDAWLTAAERAVRDELVFEKRRTDWLLGRLAAKRAVIDALGMEALERGALDSLARIEILADDRGRPRAGVREADLAPAVSVSHASGVGFAAAALAGADLGCDIEAVAPRSDAFLADYFTAPERAAMAAAPEGAGPLLANLIWSAKESALKVLGVGLRVDTRAVTVETDGLTLEGSPRTNPRSGSGDGSPGERPTDQPGWAPLEVRTSDGARFLGHWRVHGGLVWTVLAPSPAMIEREIGQGARG